MFRVLLKRHSLKELVKAVQEKESAGWHCVYPIRHYSERKKDFAKAERKVWKYAGDTDYKLYYVTMEKESLKI